MARLNEEDPYFESSTYLDGKPFKAYTEKVRRVIVAHESPVSTRVIHLVLGEEAKPEWTADALEFISGIQGVGINPTRYQIVPPRHIPTTPFNGHRSLENG